MELSKIIITETSEEQVVVLKEVEGSRAFPIVIGIWEAIAINRYVNRQKTPRPMTHDLLTQTIRNLGFSLERIIVNDLKEGVFFARLVLKRNGKSVEVDSRPSDAIALAVQWNCPIYVEERVIEEVAKPSEGNPGGFSSEEPGDEGDEGEEDTQPGA
jgi:bifunctional DNase/RNase